MKIMLILAMGFFDSGVLKKLVNVRVSPMCIKGIIKNALRYCLNITLGAYYFSRFLFVSDKPSAPVWISITKAQIKNRINAWRARNRGFIAINHENMKKYKNSDTLVILGSGPSINDIEDTEWEMIKRCDSFAFNSFYAHPFIPTYYHLELYSGNKELHRECYSLKSNDFKKIPMILNFNHLSKEEVASDFSYITDCYVSIPFVASGINSEQKFSEMIEFLDIDHIFSKKSLLIHHRASLFLAISFAVIMGYKKIVLAGVDMFDMEYFFFDADKYSDEIASKLRVAKLESCIKARGETAENIHKVADPSLFNTLPLDKAIVIFNEKYLKPREIDLLLLSNNSLLYPRIRELEKNGPTSPRLQ